MDTRGWRPRDLIRESGLKKQTVSLMLNDDREVLPQMPRAETVAALARAFGPDVDESVVRTVAAAAMGVQETPVIIRELPSASDAELLAELGRRLRAARRKTAKPARQEDDGPHE